MDEKMEDKDAGAKAPDLKNLRLRPPAPEEAPQNSQYDRNKIYPKENNMAYGENPGSGNVKINPNPPSDPGKRPSRGCWFLAGMGGCGCLLLLLALLPILLAILLFQEDWDSGKTVLKNEAKIFSSDFKREFLSGKKGAPSKIAVISVRGVITSNEENLSSGACSRTICKIIKEAGNDDSIKGVIIDLETPGGEVTASDEIYHELTLLRKKKPVIAYMNSICASGGYYVAAACNPIIANKLTLTGSIGVIISTYNYKGLFDKLGLKAELYTSGSMKAMLNGASERTSAEKAIVRKLVMNTYHTFTDIVSRSRGIPVNVIRNGQIGDGRIFDGKQALELNLVDALGYFQDAVVITAKEAKIKGEWEVFRFEESFNLERFFRDLFVKAPIVRLLPDASGKTHLEAGRLYFLPPGL